MDPTRQAEEMLREAACFGDEESVRVLVKSGVNVNVQHSVNGWTPLHWATKRGHISVVRYLLSAGADPTLASVKGETPLDVAPNDEIRALLTGGVSVETCDRNTDEKSSSSSSSSSSQSPLPITPNYLAHPPLAHKVNLADSSMSAQRTSEVKQQNDARRLTTAADEELVVKVRTSNPPNQDFIEVEVPYKDLSFASLLKTCCEELEINMQKVLKLRKLPNTILRKDKDVLRLQNFVELEVVLLPDEYLDFSMTNGCASRSRAVPEINGFIKNASFLNKSTKSMPSATHLFQKSSICKDGVILY